MDASRRLEAEWHHCTVSGSSYNEAFNSGCGAGVCGGYLDPNHYADYADYLEDFVTFFDDNAGFKLYAISMQNEPDANTGYESCVWDPLEMDAWVAGNASTITTVPAYPVKFIMPESEDFNPVDAATALSDPNAVGKIGIVAGHIYQYPGYGPIVAYAWPAGVTPKELWMTESAP